MCVLNRVRMVFTAGLLLASSAAAADWSGIWSATTTDRNGDVQDLSFRLSQKGSAISGKMYGDNESTPIADAAINGDQITFSVTNELNGAITKFVYTGRLNGDELDLVRERSGQNDKAAKPEAAKPDGAASKPNPKQTFKLKRLA